MMKNATARGRTDEGSALLITVGYLAVITIVAATFLGYLNRTISSQHRVESKQVCLNIAEGGLEKALAELRARPDQYLGEQDTVLGEGRFSVEVKPGTRSGEYTIISTAELTDDGLALSSARVVANAVLAPDGAVRELDWLEVKRW